MSVIVVFMAMFVPMLVAVMMVFLFMLSLIHI